ncbi:hypothetical protein GCM10017620_31360 [Brevundimonas intermedia]|uniref:Flagellar M-ring N-terminal domain-containing protein n=1 Tax=Brevundimonas intermedia TaxID=74315 RepID=A0ABQ5TCL8_9CAUL|nr:flagellar basal-body MS-ring/collar protein FliF [Brevundimonas intermedia]GLK50162.1 hypothetical protein GCM10017620_31360 [Brevundimonas intermedia]
MSLLQRLRGLSPVFQIALAVGVALALAAGLVVAYLTLRPRYEVLFRDLRPADAATILAQLEKDKTPHRVADGGTAILAPEDQVDEIRLAILGADLPLKGTVGFELFNKSDMGLTEFAQRINYQRALQGELSRTIMTMDAIDSARVHLTLSEPSVFRADRKPAKASVALAPRRGRVLTADTVAGVRRLVAAAVPELDAAAVVVVDATGAAIAGDEATAINPSEAAASPVLAQTRAIEAYYTAALRRALAPLYPGVQVSVIAPADQWAPGLDGESQRRSSLSDWSPQSRGFRLQVSTAAPTGLSDAQREDVARVVVETIGWSQALGDTLMFPDWRSLRLQDASASERRAAGPAAEVSRPVVEPSTPAGASGPRPGADGLMTALVSAAIALVLLTAGAFVWRRGRPRRLSEAEREAYVRRLQRLLDAEPDHG